MDCIQVTSGEGCESVMSPVDWGVLITKLCALRCPSPATAAAATRLKTFEGILGAAVFRSTVLGTLTRQRGCPFWLVE